MSGHSVLVREQSAEQQLVEIERLLDGPSPAERCRASELRAAEPWEVANVIVFLASAYSAYTTDEAVSVSSQHL